LVPMNKEIEVTGGYCHIAQLMWSTATCMRYNHSTSYDVPSFSGYFWKHMNPEEASFTRLSVDSSHMHDNNFKDIGLANPNVFLAGDLTDKSLLNCANASISSTKQLLVNYLPLFKGVLNVNSTTKNLPKYYPKQFIDCSFRNQTHVYLTFKRVSRWMVALFVATMFLIGGGLYLIVEHDDDGPIKEFSMMISMPILLASYLLHAILYLIFVAVIGWSIFNIEPALSLEESFKKGSIFIIFKWIYQKIKSCCQPRGSTSS